MGFISTVSSLISGIAEFKRDTGNTRQVLKAISTETAEPKEATSLADQVMTNSRMSDADLNKASTPEDVSRRHQEFNDFLEKTSKSVENIDRTHDANQHFKEVIHTHLDDLKREVSRARSESILDSIRTKLPELTSADIKDTTALVNYTPISIESSAIIAEAQTEKVKDLVDHLELRLSDLTIKENDAIIDNLDIVLDNQKEDKKTNIKSFKELMQKLDNLESTALNTLQLSTIRAKQHSIEAKAKKWMTTINEFVTEVAKQGAIIVGLSKAIPELLTQFFEQLGLEEMANGIKTIIEVTGKIFEVLGKVAKKVLNVQEDVENENVKAIEGQEFGKKVGFRTMVADEARAAINEKEYKEHNTAFNTIYKNTSGPYSNTRIYELMRVLDPELAKEYDKTVGKNTAITKDKYGVVSKFLEDNKEKLDERMLSKYSDIMAHSFGDGTKEGLVKIILESLNKKQGDLMEKGAYSEALIKELSDYDFYDAKYKVTVEKREELKTADDAYSKGNRKNFKFTATNAGATPWSIRSEARNEDGMFYISSSTELTDDIKRGINWDKMTTVEQNRVKEAYKKKSDAYAKWKQEELARRKELSKHVINVDGYSALDDTISLEDIFLTGLESFFINADMNDLKSYLRKMDEKARKDGHFYLPDLSGGDKAAFKELITHGLEPSSYEAYEDIVMGRLPGGYDYKGNSKLVDRQVYKKGSSMFTSTYTDEYSSQGNFLNQLAVVEGPDKYKTGVNATMRNNTQAPIIVNNNNTPTIQQSNSRANRLRFNNEYEEP